jgi:hypothetical protein
MRSIWIAIGRDPDFGAGKTGEHIYVFESSFDAWKFVNRIQDYDHLPAEARAVKWDVSEHPINLNKVPALNEFSAIYLDNGEDYDD